MFDASTWTHNGVFNSMRFVVGGSLGFIGFSNRTNLTQYMGFNPGANGVITDGQNINFSGGGGANALMTVVNSSSHVYLYSSGGNRTLGGIRYGWQGLYYRPDTGILIQPTSDTQGRASIFMSSSGTTLATSTNQAIGFFGNQIVQPANIADTSGANVSSLEVEVNDMKQMLRDYGLMGS